MTTLPGLSVACQFIYWFAGLISRGEFSKEQVEDRQSMIEEIMRPGYEPTPAMLEAVRRACGVFYPKIEVLAQIGTLVVPSQEADKPCIDRDLSEHRGQPEYHASMIMVRMTGGMNRTLLAYLTELKEQGYKTAGPVNTSAYLSMARSDHQVFKDLPTGEFYYDGGGRIMNEKGNVGITSDNMRDFDCNGSSFLVVRTDKH